MDPFHAIVWTTYAVVVVMTVAALLFGNERVRVRGSKLFYPLAIFALILSFADGPLGPVG
jgi:hypothetical protein